MSRMCQGRVGPYQALIQMPAAVEAQYRAKIYRADLNSDHAYEPVGPSESIGVALKWAIDSDFLYWFRGWLKGGWAAKMGMPFMTRMCQGRVGPHPPMIQVSSAFEGRSWAKIYLSDLNSDRAYKHVGRPPESIGRR